MDKRNLTAPCGLDCFNCPTFRDNISEEQKATLAAFLKIPVEETPCNGCRDEKGNCKFADKNHSTTWDCALKKGVDYCFECSDFPCGLFRPTHKGANYPHNMKVYNLCRMKLVGIDNWIEESKEIRKLYYEGEFKVGKGPVFE